MRVLKIPEDGPKRKLLDAAELLISENGFDTVSVRHITGAVKANVAAINYHFGGRENLMALIMARLLGPLCEERLKGLEKTESKRGGKMASPAKIISAFIESLSTTAELLEMNLLFYLRLVGRVLVLPSDKMERELANQRESVTGKFLTALASALPDTTETELAANWRFFESGLSQALLTLTSEDNIAVLFEQWITFGSNGFGEAGSTNTASVPKAVEKEVKKEDPQELLFDF